MKHTPPN